MKLVVILVCFGVFVGVAKCENCTTNADCTNTICAGDGQAVVCQHPDGAGIEAGRGLCTCQDDSGLECTLAADCYGSGSTLSCADNVRHCYDNKCICDRFVIGRRVAE